MSTALMPAHLHPFAFASVFCALTLAATSGCAANDNERDAIEVVGGEYVSGFSSVSFGYQPGSHQIGTLAVDRLEVTAGDYLDCVVAGACPDIEGLNGLCNLSFGTVVRDRHPVNCVTLADAEAYCSFVDARLPTIFEWSWIAHRGDARPYPWGADEPSCEIMYMAEWPQYLDVGCGLGSTGEVDTKPRDTTPDGVQDLGGNVQELTSTPWNPADETFGPTVGGSHFASRAAEGAAANFFWFEPSRTPEVGFRCVRDI